MLLLIIIIICNYCLLHTHQLIHIGRPMNKGSKKADGQAGRQIARHKRHGKTGARQAGNQSNTLLLSLYYYYYYII